VATKFSDYYKDLVACKNRIKILRPTININTDRYISGLAWHLGIDGCMKAGIKNKPTQTKNTKYEFTNLLLAQPIGFTTRWRLWLGRQRKSADNRFICGEFTEWAYNNAEPFLFPDWHKGNPREINESNLFEHHEFTF
jgi:hypothetical protein